VSQKIEKILSDCYGLACFSQQCGNARVCAAVVDKTTVVSFGFNKMKTSPWAARFSKAPEAIFVHAELAALKAALAKTDPAGMSLYIARAKYTDETKTAFTRGLAMPCEGCRKAIQEFKIKEVYYTLDETGFGYYSVKE
jgi:deoxycytidylate deaminase